MTHDCFNWRPWPNLSVLSCLVSLCVISSVFPSVLWAETWVCPQKGQSDLYTDREYPGCKPLGEIKTYSPVTIAPAPPSSKSAISSPSPAPAVVPGDPPQAQGRKPMPFQDVSLSLPVIAVSQPKGGSITGAWMGLVARLIVSYKADGRGPEILGDANLMPVSAYSFQTAVAVASKAVGYDPRYLSVRLLVPIPLEGPSAGGIYAVGIASALLGDSIRQDICMSGTIEPDAEIHPVGRLVDKMGACRDLRKTTMIVPDGLDNSHLSFTGAERSIQVIQVHTLTEAYSAATGQVLRHAP
jgi:hypothetical protein